MFTTKELYIFLNISRPVRLELMARAASVLLPKRASRPQVTAARSDRFSRIMSGGFRSRNERAAGRFQKLNRPSLSDRPLLQKVLSFEHYRRELIGETVASSRVAEEVDLIELIRARPCLIRIDPPLDPLASMDSIDCQQRSASDPPKLFGPTPLAWPLETLVCGYKSRGDRGTLTRLYHETAERVEVDVLNGLCRYLGCTLGELLEYIPDEEAKGAVK